MVSLSPKAAGAETAVDIGVFCVGAAAGGLVDALLNSFGFAEPLIVASLGGTGALGLKKLLWDSWRKTPRRVEQFSALRAEADLMEAIGDKKQADALRHLIDRAEQAKADPATVRKLFQELRKRF